MWDKQGILRGECCCGDCQEFMAGSDIRCEYCDCAPTMHNKLDKLAVTGKDYSTQTFKDFPEQPNHINDNSHFSHKCSQCNKLFKDQYTRRKHEKRVHKVSPASGCKVDTDGYIIADRPIKQEPEDQGDMNEDILQGNTSESDTTKANTNTAIVCLTCNRNFKSLRSRNRHMKSFHSDSKYTCPLCNNQFKLRQNLQKHINEKHSDSSMSSSMKNKIVEKTDEGEASVIPSGGDLEGNVLQDPDWDADTDLDAYPEEEQNNDADSFEDVKPLAQITSVTGSCELLPVISSIIGNMDEFHSHGNNTVRKQEEINNVSQGGEVKSKKKRKSSKPIKVVIPTGSVKTPEKMFKCQQCEKAFATEAQQKRHQRNAHPSEKVFNCQHCEKLFATEMQQKKHERNAHSSNEFPCQYCGKIYKRRYELVDHERSHTGLRPFSCETCGKSFFSKHNLRTHELLHKIKGTFQCQFCGRDFDSKGGMIYHERSHTGERPYACQVCHKTFGHKSILICHERIHTGEKPYPCTHCTKRFRDHSTLRKHIRIHTLEKPYKCNLCDKAYNQRWCLRAHEKQHLADGTLAPKPQRKAKSTQNTPLNHASTELQNSDISLNQASTELQNSDMCHENNNESESNLGQRSFNRSSGNSESSSSRVYDMSTQSSTHYSLAETNNVPIDMVQHAMTKGMVIPRSTGNIETESNLSHVQRIYDQSAFNNESESDLGQGIYNRSSGNNESESNLGQRSFNRSSGNSESESNLGQRIYNRSSGNNESESNLIQGQRIYDSYMSGGPIQPHINNCSGHVPFFQSDIPSPSSIYNHVTSRSTEVEVAAGPKNYHQN